MLLGLLLTFALPPDPTTDADVLAHLESTDLNTQAWAAFAAGLRGIDAAVPVLIERLRETNAAVKQGGGQQVIWLRNNVLDALILLHAQVPHAELQALVGTEERPEAIILMSWADKLAPSDAVVFFEAARTLPEQRAAVNALASAPAPSLVSRLLDALVVEIQVAVVDQPTTLPRIVVSSIDMSSSSSHWEPSLQMPDGTEPYHGEAGSPRQMANFPPEVSYRLMPGGAAASATLLSANIAPVSYERVYHTKWRGPREWSPDKAPRSEHATYLSHFAGRGSKGFASKHHHEHTWQDEQHLRRAIQALRQRHEQAYALLIADLAKRGQITQPAPPVKLKFSLKDHRLRSNTPLPTL